MSVRTVLEQRFAEVNRDSPRFQMLQSLLDRRLPLNSANLAADRAQLLNSLRDKAAAIASEQQLPGKKDEEWRFTDISALVESDFTPATSGSEDGDIDITPFIVPECDRARLVFVNGVFSSSLSDCSALDGQTAVNLCSDSLSSDKISSYLGKQSGSEEVFTALNTASLTDSAIVWIKANQIIEQPIHLLFITREEDKAAIANPRCLIIAEANSSATIVEQYITLSSCPATSGTSPYFNNSVTEVWLDNNAEVNHTRIQQEGQHTIHIGKTAVSQKRDSRYTINAVSLGAKLSRHNLEIFQQGEGVQTTLNGLTEIAGGQTADTHSRVHHLYPNGGSDQLHKCIVDDRAHAVFNGKVFVPQAAQLTNADQLNRNLVLSQNAKVDTKPELQITADNVKCSHGATVSQLQEEEVFYLQSRGLSKDDSQHLLIDAFAGEILQRIPVKSLNKLLAQCLSCRTHLS